MLKGVTGLQRLVLAVLFALLWVASFHWWRANDSNTAILATFPSWGADGYVLYDGYGEYAAHIRAAIAHPSDETFEALSGFAAGYIHSLRPLYPLLVALLDLVLGNIVASASLANFIGVLAFFAAWDRMLTKHFGFEGRDLFLLHVLALAHVSTIGMLARPVADSLAMFFVTVALDAALDMRRIPGPRPAVVCAAALLLGICTKLIAAMLLPVLAATLLVQGANGSRSRAALLVGGAGCVLLLGIVLLFAVAPGAAATGFIRDAFKGARTLVTTMPVDGEFVRAAALFLVLGLQAWVLFACFNTNALRHPWRIHFLWIAFYVGQRLLFHGFSLSHSRARYGFPLVASVLILGYPGLKRIVGERWIAAACAAMAGLNVAVWILVLLRETA